MRLLKIFLFLSVFSAALSSIAQEKGTVSFGAGSGFPIGEFGDKNINRNSAGLASPGLSLDVAFDRRIKKRFSICFMLRHVKNDVDDELIMDNLKA